MPAGYPFLGSKVAPRFLFHFLWFLRIVFSSKTPFWLMFFASLLVQRIWSHGFFSIYPFVSCLASLLFQPKSLSIVCTFWLLEPGTKLFTCFHADELAAASRHTYMYREPTHAHNTNMNLILSVVRIWKSKSTTQFSFLFSLIVVANDAVCFPHHNLQTHKLPLSFHRRH